MDGPTPAEFEAAGLYDPDDTETVGRLDLLRWLAEEGFTIEQMQRGLETGALGSMVSDRWLLGGPTFGREEAIRRTGLDEATFDAYTVALGVLSLDGVDEGGLLFTDDLLGLFHGVAALEGIFSASEVLALVRTIGTSVSRMADSAVTVFLTDVESDHVIARRSDYELGQLALSATKMLEGLGARLDPLLRRHVLQAIERTRIASIDQFERFQYHYAVGFVDLVGFTPMSASLSAKELVEFMADFEARSHEVVAQADARVVKLIGDEVMFVATDADAGCRAGSALIETFTADADGVDPRGGMAFGAVALRGGDYFGSVVNLASRLTDEALPGELLVSAALAETASGCSFRPAGLRLLKGFGEPVEAFALADV
jgi:class 3 adenylate cyclase